jgi:hypothetical protein
VIESVVYRALSIGLVFGTISFSAHMGYSLLSTFTLLLYVVVFLYFANKLFTFIYVDAMIMSKQQLEMKLLKQQEPILPKQDKEEV